MSGTVLSAFNQFVANTPLTVFSGANDFVNEAVDNTYLLSKFLRGSGDTDTVQGGEKITDYLILDEQNMFSTYKPGQPVKWKNRSGTQQWEVPWRFSWDQMAWAAQEVELNSAGMTRSAIKGKFKSVLHQKEVMLRTSILNGMEAQVIAPPTADMESNTGETPYSLWALVNEETNGLYDGFTTVLQIDPATYPQWVPQRVEYDASSPENLADGLFPAFRRMWNRVGFQLPKPFMDVQSPSLSKENRCIITSETGQVQYETLLQRAQDLFVAAGRQDPAYTAPQFRGIPIEYIAGMDELAIYDDGASGRTTEDLADRAGARYCWLDLQTIRMFFHKERYIKKGEVREIQDQLDSYACPVTVWNNMICRSRRRNGFITPS
ncbi:MAG: hypothetical protein ABL309_13820 [Phycisphaerales bacterium]